MKYLFVIAIMLLCIPAHANDAQKIQITKKIITTYFEYWRKDKQYDYIQYYGTPSLKKLLKQAVNQDMQMYGNEDNDGCVYNAGGYLIGNYQDMNGNGRIYNLKVVANGDKVNATYHDKYNNYLVQFTFTHQNGKYLINDVRSGASESLKQKPKLNGWSLRSEAVKAANGQCDM